MKTDQASPRPPNGRPAGAAGHASAFGRFLREHPAIQRALDKAIAQRARNSRAGTFSVKSIHLLFVRECFSAGIARSAYPLNTLSCGRWSIERYVHKKLGARHARKARRDAGVATIRPARSGGGDEN